MVLTCAVTTSPTSPLPLVDALTILPFSYKILSVSPSNLYSQVSVGKYPTVFTMRLHHSKNSSFDWHLSRL